MWNGDFRMSGLSYFNDNFLREMQKRLFPTVHVLRGGFSEVDVLVIPAIVFWENPREEWGQAGHRTNREFIFPGLSNAHSHVIKWASFRIKELLDRREGSFRRQTGVRVHDLECRRESESIILA